MTSGPSTVIDRKLQALKTRLEFLRARGNMGQDAFLDDETTQMAVELAFQHAIEACLDISRQILMQAGASMPDRNRDLFAAAAALGAVPRELVDRMARMVGFRNILVHEYETIDAAQVYRALTTGLGDLDAFAAAVVDHLRRCEPEP